MKTNHMKTNQMTSTFIEYTMLQLDIRLGNREV